MISMSRYKTGFIDPRAQKTRNQMLQGSAKDFGEKAMRWALHMSEEESAWLEFHNPDTLGNPDLGLRQGYWKHFIESQESTPYRMRTKV